MLLWSRYRRGWHAWARLCRACRRQRHRRRDMTTVLADWKAHCSDIVRCSDRIFQTEVKITDKGFADPQFLALALLARTISNLKGAVILLDALRIVEARTITRSCFENLYWTVGLAE